MKAAGLPDSSVTQASAGQPARKELPGPGSQTAVATVADSTDSETRHRLRRVLRILLAARRRDDGGAGHIEDN
jgi:hypothetical protein